jgi:hypothetical protein
MQIPEIPDLIHYAIPFFVSTVILEIILTVKVKLEDYEFKDASTSIIMGLGNVFISIFTKIMILAVFLFLYQFRFFTIPFFLVGLGYFIVRRRLLLLLVS